MIMPSSVHIAKSTDLKAFPLPSKELETTTDEPQIELVDNETSPKEDVVKPSSNGHTPAATSTPPPPRITRKDAIIDKTDKMCASGKPAPVSSHSVNEILGL